MKIVFDPDIAEEVREELLKTLKEQNFEEICRVCGANTVYVALIDNTLDVKCYECGHSFIEIELAEEE